METKMKLIDIMKIADAAYSDGILSLHGFYDPETGEPNYGYDEGDTLAEFICIEIAETYDPDVDDQGQLDEAARVIGNAAEQLSNVVAALIEASMKVEVYGCL